MVQNRKKLIHWTAFGILLICSFFFISCQTVTISPSGNKHRYSSMPTYERTQNFFFWGLAGTHVINVQSICRDREILQMQTQNTFINQLLVWLTLGIYTPRTVKVWCGR